MFPPPVSWVPPNCVFEVDDVLRDWTWREPFDFIHVRLMYGALPPDGWNRLYKEAYDALEPGGWIEQMELDVRVYSDDSTLKKDHKLWGSAIKSAGFVDVHEVKYKIPIGHWPKDKLLKEAGYLQYAHWNAALEGWAMWLLTHFGEPKPWTKDEVQVFLAQVRAELKNPQIHAYEPANRVWARKPTDEELQERAKFKVQESSKSIVC